MESEDDARTFVNRSFFKTKTYKYLTIYGKLLAHLQSSVFKLSKDLIDSIHEEGIVAYTS